jgi:hypothetical protein
MPHPTIWCLICSSANEPSVIRSLRLTCYATRVPEPAIITTSLFTPQIQAPFCQTLSFRSRSGLFGEIRRRGFGKSIAKLGTRHTCRARAAPPRVVSDYSDSGRGNNQSHRSFRGRHRAKHEDCCAYRWTRRQKHREGDET